MIRRLSFLLILLFVCTGSAMAQASYSGNETGETPLGSYFSTDIDNVSLKDGNLHVSIPLFTLPGRELPVSVSMDYNSQLYEYRCIWDPSYGCINYIEFLGWRKNTGVGGILNASKAPASAVYYGGGGYYYQNMTVSFTWIEWSGTKHTFSGSVTRTCGYLAYANGQTYCASPTPDDNTIYDNLNLQTGGSEFVKLSTGNYFSGGSAPAKVYFKDGHTVNVTAHTSITPNGNFITGNASTQTATLVPSGGTSTAIGDFLPSTDTTGRNIAWSDNGTTQTISLTDANGNAKTYGITWTNITVNAGTNRCAPTNSQFRVVSSIQLPNGKSYSFQYNANGYLTRLTLPSGAYIRYSYVDNLGSMNCNLYVAARTVSSDGTTASEKSYGYNYDWQQYQYGDEYEWYYWLADTTVTSPSAVAETHYFAQNFCGFETACVGLETKIVTSQNGTSYKTIDKTWNGGTNPSVYSEKTTLYINQSQRVYTYDGYNNLIQEDEYDWGAGAVGPRLKYTTRSYSASNSTYSNAWMLTRPLTEKTYTNAGALIAETDYELDNYASPRPMVTRSGTIPGWADPGTTTRGNVTAIKRWLNTNNSWETTYQQHDVLGNVANVTDPGGHVTATDFTDNFTDNTSRNTFAYAKRVTPPNAFYADTKYDFNTGLPKQTTDSLSRTTTMTYDVMNRPTQVTNPDGSWTTNTFDDTEPKTTVNKLVDVQGNVGRVIHHFDLLYREIKKETADPSGNIFVDTQYDGNGRKWKVSNPYRNGDTVLWTTTGYDPLDRPVTVTAPDSSAVGYAYTDNQTTVTDEAGNQRRYTYDGLGRMTKVEEPNLTLSTPLVTTYTYNVLGKLTQTVQGSQTRTFNFDSLGRMTSQVLPESGTTSFTYNADDLLLTKTDARNITSTITYDSTQVHQPYSHTYSDSTPAVSFGYNALGLKTSMTDAVGSVAYTYDSNNDRLTQESRTLTGVTGTFTTGYGYNKKGDLTSMTYPSGRVVNFNYVTGSGCCNSRLDSVVDQTTSTTLNYNLTYNPAGEVTAHTLGNGISQTYSYNNRLEQTAITASLSGTSVMNFAYDYGTSTTNTGRVLARTDSIQQEHSAKYIYDSIYRLGQSISNDSSWGVAWTFDTWGNRVTQTPQGLATSKVGTQTLGYTNNRLTGNTYDAAGNQTNDGSHSYTFSAENQILSMDGGAATYAYDGEGRRTKKVTSTETTYTFYGPGGIISEFTTSNAIASATGAASTDKCFYHTSDKLGSAVLVMNASGLVIENNRTLPYGEAWIPESTPSTNDKKFTTYQRDQESGLDYAMNRYYANTTGRFQSSDQGKMHSRRPITLNRYVYAMDDPINHIDPDGNDSDEDPPEDPLEFIRPPQANGGAWFRALGRLSDAIDAIENRSMFSAPCQNDIAAIAAGAPKSIDKSSITLEAIQAVLVGTDIRNGVGSKDPASVLYPTSPFAQRAVGGITVGSYFAANPLGLTAKTALGGNLIYINPSMIKGNLTQNEGLLMHEALHELGIDDDHIGSGLGSIDKNIRPDSNGNWSNTNQFSQKLAKDCFTGKDNKN